MSRAERPARGCALRGTLDTPPREPCAAGRSDGGLLGLARQLASGRGLRTPRGSCHSRCRALRKSRLRHSGNPLGMLWPDMDAAFVSAGGGRGPPPAARRPVVTIAAGYGRAEGRHGGNPEMRAMSACRASAAPPSISWHDFHLVARQTSASTRNVAPMRLTGVRDRAWGMTRLRRVLARFGVNWDGAQITC